MTDVCANGTTGGHKGPSVNEGGGGGGGGGGQNKRYVRCCLPAAVSMCLCVPGVTSGAALLCLG